MSVVDSVFQLDKEALGNVVDSDITSFMTNNNLFQQNIPSEMFRTCTNSTMSSDDPDSDKDYESVEQNRYWDISEDKDKTWSESEETIKNEGDSFMNFMDM